MGERSIRFISLDPGETTGFAFFDQKGELIKFGTFKQKDQHKWLDEYLTPDLIAVIVEDYRNFAWKRQKNWSQNQTSKNIGAIEMVCHMRSIPIHLQPANIKSIGYKWAGIEQPKDHSLSHGPDAYVHGLYWLRTNGVRKAEIPDADMDM